ncbi:MAG TPA: hypothetical protein PLI95_11865 [Polyangiaceae bacterium]|nr:hypothetical protein [Polyangiaceae bacterium]
MPFSKTWGGEYEWAVVKSQAVPCCGSGSGAGGHEVRRVSAWFESLQAARSSVANSTSIGDFMRTVNASVVPSKWRDTMKKSVPSLRQLRLPMRHRALALEGTVAAPGTRSVLITGS